MRSVGRLHRGGGVARSSHAVCWVLAAGGICLFVVACFAPARATAVVVAFGRAATTRRWRCAANGAAPLRGTLLSTPGRPVTQRWASDTLTDGTTLRESLQTAATREARATPRVLSHFATQIYRNQLTRSENDVAELNEELLAEAARLREEDTEGIRWSEQKYRNGYTSYASLRSLQRFLEPVEQLERWLEPHVRQFRAYLDLEPGLPDLFMTDSWINVMGPGGSHGMHQHGSSTISGTYYVQTPEGCPGIRFEDPRLDRMEAEGRRQLIEYPVHAGDVVLFESWMRHEVPQNDAERDRVSVSFNFHWRLPER